MVNLLQIQAFELCMVWSSQTLLGGTSQVSTVSLKTFCFSKLFLLQKDMVNLRRSSGLTGTTRAERLRSWCGFGFGRGGWWTILGCLNWYLVALAANGVVGGWLMATLWVVYDHFGCSSLCFFLLDSLDETFSEWGDLQPTGSIKVCFNSSNHHISDL